MKKVAGCREAVAEVDTCTEVELVEVMGLEAVANQRDLAGAIAQSAAFTSRV